MMKRRSWLLALLFFMFVLSACASGGSKYLGKSLDPRDISSINAANEEHTYSTRSFSIRYTYSVESDHKHLVLDGRITSLLDPAKHPLGTVLNRLTYEDIYIWALFTNESGMVIDAQEIHITSNDQIFIPVKFNQILSFDPAYRGISLRMRANMRDGLLMVDSHLLDSYKRTF